MAFGLPTKSTDDWFATQPPPQAHDTRQTASGIMAPPQSAEDQRLMQDPAFAQRYNAWVDAQGPGAADWATPTGYLQQTGQSAPTGTGTPAPTGTAAPPGGGGADPFAIMRQAAQGLPPTGASLDPILAALRAQGIQATRATHGGGAGDLPSDDAIVLPDGRVVDLIHDVSGNAKWGDFSPSGEIYSGTRNVIGPDGKPVTFGQYAQTNKLTVLPGGGAGGGQNPAGYGGYDPGYADRLGYTGNLQMDPGFQFRLQQGQQAIERSAAAKGTLLTGGTLKGLTRYAQDYSSNEFQNRYQRLLGEQQNRYTQLYGLSALGQNSAAQQGVQNTNYANQTGDIQLQRGNTNAAGTVAGSNATNTAIQNSVNQAQQLWLAKLYGNQQPGTTPPPTGPGNTPIAQNPNLRFFNQ